jgi:LuxR family maltose regulon positive regulatory protein
MRTHRADDSNHLIRHRINTLLSNASENPVIIVCGGAGCGKTRAVSDFLRQQKRPCCWLRFDERDNEPARFWESFTDTVMQYDGFTAEKFREVGFPDAEEKQYRFEEIKQKSLRSKFGLFVWDDFHLLEEPAILNFVQKSMINMPPGSSTLLVCRGLPGINIDTLQIKGLVSEINEKDLNFTESELAEYLRKQEIPVDSQTIREIQGDTSGWAFAVDLATRSLKKNPNYFGYVKNTLRQNLHKLMETESWEPVPQRLKQFLAGLSLIGHLSAELVGLLADGNDALLSAFNAQNAYVRFDSYGGAYLIHPLYLEFLRSKQDILTAKEKNKIYKATADWCNQNNYKADALSYYEKIGDYGSIVSVLRSVPMQIPADMAQHAKGIFDRAPAEVFDRVLFFASMHINAVSQLGDAKEALSLAFFYEKKFLALPEEDAMRNSSLSGIYFYLGMLHSVCTYDGKYDFDIYFTKMFDCLSEENHHLFALDDFPRAPWINLTSSALKGEPQKYIEAMKRGEKTAARFANGVTMGADELIQGEMLFYQGSIQTAEPYVVRAMENAKKRMAFDTLHRALFYLMRISVAEGNIKKAEASLREMEELMGETRYLQRFTTYDIAFGWFQYILRQPDTFPRWLTEKFSPYAHASAMENFGNQAKARYCYLTRNFLPLLLYIREMKQRESFLLGRVEMLAMEACVHYKMKNKDLAWKALKEAYETAAPNDILMPFIELGKDMRTLTAAASREQSDASAAGMGIPRSWLESVRYKATSYAKSQSMFINENKKIGVSVKTLSAREQDVLSDLYHGFSQVEIAGKLNLSVNTVKMVTKSIYEKLHVHKISDLVRVAAEQGLV